MTALSGAAQRSRELESLLLAAVLFLLGEKSLVLARVGMRTFHAIYDGKISEPRYIYEISLFGLMIGTCCVVLISIWRKNTLKRDNVAILAGVITATLAALLNIADEITAPGSAVLGGIPIRGFFFIGLWTVLVIVPGFLPVVRHDGNGEVDVRLLGKLVAALVIGALIGAILQPILLAGVRESLVDGSIDHFRFRPFSLVILSSVWIVAAFSPSLTRGRSWWRVGYLLLAPIAGFLFSAVIAKPDGDQGMDVSTVQMAFGYALLAAAAIVPSLVFAKGIVGGELGPSLKAGVATYFACFAAMYFGLSDTWDLNVEERIALSGLQAIAGAMGPVSAFAALRLMAWVRRTSDEEGTTEHLE